MFGPAQPARPPSTPCAAPPAGASFITTRVARWCERVVSVEERRGAFRPQGTASVRGHPRLMHRRVLGLKKGGHVWPRLHHSTPVDFCVPLRDQHVTGWVGRSMAYETSLFSGDSGRVTPGSERAVQTDVVGTMAITFARIKSVLTLPKGQQLLTAIRCLGLDVKLQHAVANHCLRDALGTTILRCEQPAHPPLGHMVPWTWGQSRRRCLDRPKRGGHRIEPDFWYAHNLLVSEH